ncbi:MAG: ATP-binding protein, partial [Pseudoflavonifractor sp.]
FWSAGGRLGMIGFVLMGYVLAFRTLTVILTRDADRAETRQVTAQLALSEQYYESLVGQIEETRVRDHDLRHHIAALSGLCAQGEPEKAQEYLNAMLGTLPEKLPKHYCKVGAVNALLGHFELLCQEGGIRFHCEISLPESLEVEPLSLCVIFGNALQNAVEANLAVEDATQRFLSLKVAPAQGRLAIELSNRCTQIPRSDGAGGYQSTKAEPGHGLGLGSIRATVERYHGWHGTTYENGVFTLRILL